MFKLNKIQLACFGGGMVLFVIGLFFKTDVTAMVVSFLCGFVFVGAGYFMRSRTPDQPDEPQEAEPMFKETPIAEPEEPQTNPLPQTPPSRPVTLQDQLGHILDNYFSTATVKGKVTLKLSLPTQIDYKGVPVAVDSNLEVELDGSREQAQPQTQATEQKPQQKVVEYKPIED